MSRVLLRWRLLSIVLLTAVAGALGAPAAACDRCRVLGTTAFHDPASGGDAYDDALFPPPSPPSDEEVAWSNFVVQGSWPQPGGKGSTLTLTYSYQNMFDGGLLMPDGQPLPAALIRESIEEALGLWASVAPLRFVEVEDDGLFYWQGSTQHGQIRFRHIRINGPDPAIGRPIAKARAYFPGSSSVAGDVEFDNGDPWQEVGTLSAPDILGAALHEIGHSLGLGHSTLEKTDEYWTYLDRNAQGEVVTVQTPKGNAVMFWIFPRFAGPGTAYLYPDDIAGIQHIYGAGVGEVVPLWLIVPEPATLVLLLVAAAGWFARRPAR